MQVGPEAALLCVIVLLAAAPCKDASLLLLLAANGRRVVVYRVVLLARESLEVGWWGLGGRRAGRSGLHRGGVGVGRVVGAGAAACGRWGGSRAGCGIGGGCGGVDSVAPSLAPAVPDVVYMAGAAALAGSACAAVVVDAP